MLCEDGGSVVATVVDGRVVFEAGHITTVDEPALRAELRALMVGYRDQLEQAAVDARRLEPYYRAMHDRAAAIDVGLQRTLD